MAKFWSKSPVFERKLNESGAFIRRACNLAALASFALSPSMSIRHPAYPTVHVAPMMAWTDRHCRYLLRLASPSAQLFTEMVTTGALLYGKRRRLLDFDPAEHPVAVQLGGNEPEALATCARLAAERGYDEVNLNVGCPSSRVQDGEIGACLMAQPKRVADCIAAMREAVDIKVTVKCRLGIDDRDSDEFLDTFIATVAEAGCQTFYLHARLALLQGLSPAQNRSVPPLRYERVYALKQRFPNLRILLNGGIDSVQGVADALHHVDGVMIGRAAYHNPLLLADLHRALLDHSHAVDSFELFANYAEYTRREVQAGTPLKSMTRHLLGLFNGQPGARLYRQVLSDSRRLARNDPTLLHDAVGMLRRDLSSVA